VPPASLAAAIAKYGKGQSTDDLAAAVSLLMENLEARLPPMAQVVPNLFRTERLYKEEVDTLFKKHHVGGLGQAGRPGAQRGDTLARGHSLGLHWQPAGSSSAPAASQRPCRAAS
jgi:hypothetical protein